MILKVFIKIYPKRYSATGNRTPVSRVTGGDTHHYTIVELQRLRKKTVCKCIQKINSEWQLFTVSNFPTRLSLPVAWISRYGWHWTASPINTVFLSGFEGAVSGIQHKNRKNFFGKFFYTKMYSRIYLIRKVPKMAENIFQIYKIRPKSQNSHSWGSSSCDWLE